MSSKTLHLVVCFLFDYCVTVTAVGDNFEEENGDSNARFSRNGPSVDQLTRSTSRYFI